MSNGFDQLHRALIDLWDTIKPPIEWLIARPLILCAYGVICLIVVIVSILLR